MNALDRRSTRDPQIYITERVHQEMVDTKNWVLLRFLGMLKPAFSGTDSDDPRKTLLLC